jgi:5-hydroxyisourate hydrolase
MAGGISIHAVDVASGRPAQGLRVEIWRIEPASTRIAEGRLGSNGQLDHPVANGTGIEAGEYEVRFHLGEFFASEAGASFLTVAPFRFRIEEVDEHFHLPMKFTRWGYSLFRGA